MKTDSEKQQAFDKAKCECKDCEGIGEIFWNGSIYGCAHGLSLEERTLTTKIL